MPKKILENGDFYIYNEAMTDLQISINRFLESIGYQVVDFYKTNSKISLTVYKDNGIGVEDCIRINNEIRKNLIEIQDFGLEVSTPGIERKFKSQREYDIFKGKKIKILIKNGVSPAVIEGVLSGLVNGKVSILVKGQKKCFLMDNILKCQLKS